MPSASQSEYDPKYHDSLDEIPLSGPQEEFDDDPEAKAKAVKAGEAMLEAEANGGAKFRNHEAIHSLAVNGFATHILTGGANAPQSMKLGDLGDHGYRITQHAKSYLDIYEMARDAIIEAPDDEGDNSHTIVGV